MYLIDTNICIAFLKGNTQVVNQFQLKQQDCYLSTLVLGELYKGVYCSSKFEKNNDLYKYKAEIDEKRSQSLDELTALTEELDLYEDN